jgi:hypothetical protein
MLARVLGCSRLSVGNTHGSCSGERHFSCSQACNLGTVNPSRKLRRFESFTCHHVPERASELWKRGSEALFIYLVGVSKRRRFGDPESFGPQACDAQTRNPNRVAPSPPGIRREVRVHATVLAGLSKR